MLRHVSEALRVELIAIKSVVMQCGFLCHKNS